MTLTVTWVLAMSAFLLEVPAARAHAAAALPVHRETGHALGQSRAERLLALLGEA